MALITPPDNLVTWADGGGAELTDPGAAKRALGFLTAEAPAAGHVNHQLKQSGAWIEMLRKACAPEIFRNNVYLSSTDMFAAVANNPRHLHVLYNNTLGKYLAIARNFGAQGYAYDSLDGITWSNQTAVGTTIQLGKIATDGTDIVTFGGETQLYTSSTGSVAGLTYRGNTLTGAGLVAGWEVVYDATNGAYIATGGPFVVTLDNSLDDVHAPLDWTETEDWGASDIDGLAVSPTGIACITFDVNGTAFSSDGGQTWTTKAGANDFGNVVYSPASNCFFAHDSTANLLYFSENNAANTWASTGLDVQRLIVHEDVTIGIVNGSAPYQVVAFTSAPDANFDLLYTNLMSFGGNGPSVTAFISGDLADGAGTDLYTYTIDCVGNAPNLVWTNAGGDLSYAKMR